MIDRQHGNLVFECDGCGDTFETGGSEFAYVWPEASTRGVADPGKLVKK